VIADGQARPPQLDRPVPEGDRQAAPEDEAGPEAEPVSKQTKQLAVAAIALWAIVKFAGKA
jgi:hypothetical protein